MRIPRLLRAAPRGRGAGTPGSATTAFAGLAPTGILAGVLSCLASAPAPAEDLPFAQDPNPSSYRPLPRTDVVIANATLLDGAGGRLDDADVLIREGKIEAVGANLPAPSGAAIVDASGRWLTPGIIDIHSHNGIYTLPLEFDDPSTSDISEVSEPNAAETWIEHAVNVQDPAFVLALQGGVTTLQILPGSVPLFGGRTVVLKTVPGRTVADMKFPGAPQGLKMACGENPKTAFGSRGAAPTSRQGEVAAMRAAWLDARDYLRQWREHAADPEHAEAPERDLELDTLAGVLNGDLRVHLHCYRADDLTVMLALAREFDFRIAAVHHAAEAYKIAGRLAAEDTCAAVWSDWWGFKLEAADAIRENAAFVDAAGGCAVMHSDSPFVGQHLNLEAAKAMAAGRRAGLSIAAERAILWITSNPARVLGLEARIGRIAPGYDADVVVWSGDPFSVYTRADQVYIDGAVAYDRNDPSRQPRSDTMLGRPSAQALP